MMQDIGQRIAIIGRSCAGKLTLAHALSKQLNIPVTHLDQLAHKPDTNWQREDDVIFERLHDEEIAKDSWIVEGNYSFLMPQRFARAETVIWLDTSFLLFFYRVFKRAFQGRSKRIGQLKGAPVFDVSAKLILYSFWNYPKNRRKYERLLAKARSGRIGENLKVVRLTSARSIERFTTMLINRSDSVM
jgi:adenylate kinase family enzyme